MHLPESSRGELVRRRRPRFFFHSHNLCKIYQEPHLISANDEQLEVENELALPNVERASASFSPPPSQAIPFSFSSLFSPPASAFLRYSFIRVDLEGRIEDCLHTTYYPKPQKLSYQYHLVLNPTTPLHHPAPNKNKNKTKGYSA